MDTKHAAMGTAGNLVPFRLLEAQPLRGPRPPSGGLIRLGAVLVTCAVAAVGAGHLLVGPSSPPVVVADIRREHLAPAWHEAPTDHGPDSRLETGSTNGVGEHRGLFE